MDGMAWPRMQTWANCIGSQTGEIADGRLNANSKAKIIIALHSVDVVV